MSPPRPWRRGDLGYCSNVHPGESLAGIRGTVTGPVAAVRGTRGLQRMAAGLWLPAAAAHTLDRDSAALAAFRDVLDAAGVHLVTVNGFPHGGFHRERVKQGVYRPSWSDPERLAYTLALARILAACGGSDELTISTLPVAERGALDAAAEARAVTQLLELAGNLAALAEDTGRRVRVCLEPEPGCLLERAAEAAALLGERLPEAARRHGVDPAAVADHLGVCYDVCHQAVMFEPAAEGLAALRAAGVTVGKVQVSSALRVPEPGAAGVHDALARYHEPRYLHQVRWRDGDGGVTGTADLDGALAHAPTDTEWRVHFHVPVQAEALDAPGLLTTRDAIDDLLAALADADAVPHLEVETYTWGVLPEGVRPATPAALTAGLAGELAWLEERLAARALLAP